MLRVQHVIASVGLSASVCSADILLVPQDFTTIQSAIDAAAPGDEIVVAPGVYQESIDFLGKGITVRSTDGPNATTITGGGAPAFVVSLINAEGPDAVLDGFTITGGQGPVSGPMSLGGGIRTALSSATLRNLIVTGNSNIFGGGLSAVGGALVVEQVTFVGNSAHTGGGAYFEGGAPTIERVTFADNHVTNNGGGLAGIGTELIIGRSSFTGNTANSFGGGAFLNTAAVAATDLDFAENGAATTGSFGSTTFHTFGGGGIYTTNTSGRIDRARFVGNRAFAGGGAYIAGSGVVELVNSVVANSVTALGGVYANASRPVLAQCTIVDNQTFGLYTTFNAAPDVRNSIFSGQTNIASTEIAGNGLTSVSATLINGDAFSVNLGSGVLLDVDPMLDADFGLRPGSPAIDAGNNTLVPSGITLDLLGAPRFADDPNTADTGVGPAPVVDLGAVEFSTQAACPGDYDGDGRHTTADFFAFLTLYQFGHSATDIDGNGMVNTNDFFAFLAIYHAGC